MLVQGCVVPRVKARGVLSVLYLNPVWLKLEYVPLLTIVLCAYVVHREWPALVFPGPVSYPITPQFPDNSICLRILEQTQED